MVLQFKRNGELYTHSLVQTTSVRNSLESLHIESKDKYNDLSSLTIIIRSSNSRQVVIEKTIQLIFCRLYLVTLL